MCMLLNYIIMDFLHVCHYNYIHGRWNLKFNSKSTKYAKNFYGIADSAYNMAADVSSSEEYQSASEGDREVEKRANERRIQSATSEDEVDQKLMTQLENTDVKSEPADSDHTTGQTDRESEECGAKMMSSLDNRYVSEEHAPEKDGSVELTEEQIKVLKP